MKIHKIVDNCCMITKEQCFRLRYGRQRCSSNPSSKDIKSCIIELVTLTKDQENEISALDDLVENLKVNKN